MTDKDKKKKDPAAVKDIDTSKIIYLGLDFGTSHCALATSSGLKLSVASAVGWPKDFIAYNVVKKQIVIGDECSKFRPSLDIVYPLERGVIKYRKNESDEETADDREAIAAVELLKYMIGLVEKKNNQKIFAVVGAPAMSGIEDKQAILNASAGLIDSILVVSEPFLVAYNLGLFGFSTIVDLGAGTLDICRMSGTIPGELDQRTSYVAGDEIDKVFFEALKKKVPGIHLTLNLARKIKEEHAFVGEGPDKIDVEFFVKGQLATVNVADELRDACSIVIPEICDSVRELIVSFDPEFMPQLLKSIVLTGGGSRIRGLEKLVEAELSDLGSAKAIIADDPFFQGALGGLQVAEEIPLAEWNQ